MKDAGLMIVGFFLGVVFIIMVMSKMNMAVVHKMDSGTSFASYKGYAYKLVEIEPNNSTQQPDK